MDPRAGEVFGPFELIEPIGSGATALVFRAVHLPDERPVALKILAPTDDAGRERFIGEVTALRRLSHPGIVEVVDSGTERDRLWLAMELVEGQPLDDWVNRVAGVNRLRRLLRAGLEVANALAAAHDVGILHRDVKPANVLVDAAGRVKLVDFGFAGHVDRPDAGGLAGTLRYMSPEHLTGAAIDRRSDLFSLGVVLFELAARRAPHVGGDRHKLIIAQCTEPAPSLAEFAPEVPAAAIEIVDRMLAKPPSRRPRSAHEVVRALNDALAAAPQAAAWRPVLLTGRFHGHASLVDSLVSRVLAGERATVLVHGPPGMGLSRLLEEVAGRALVRGARPVSLRGDQRPLFHALEELAGPQRPGAQRQALLGPDRELLLAAWPELRRHTEDIVGLARPPTPADLARALSDTFQRASADQPILMTVDDAEAADPRDLQMLQHAGLLLLTSHHPDAITLDADRVALPPLDRGQLAAIAASMLGPSGPRLAWEHADRIAGRPGRLVAMARSMGSGPPSLPSAGDDDSPSGPRVRPWEFAVREAESALSDGSPSDALRVLDEAPARTPESELQHRAALVQARAALQSGQVDAARLHAQDAARLATDPLQQSTALLAEATTALRTGELDAVRSLGELWAAEAVDRKQPALAARWDVLIARAALRAGGLSEADTRLAPHLAHPPADTSARIGVLWTAAELAVRRCRWDDARALLTRFRRGVGNQAGRRAKAGMRAVVGHFWLRRGQLDKAIEQLVRAHQDLAATSDLELLALVRGRLAEARLLAGAVDEAGRLATTAIETAARSDSRWAQPQVLAVGLRHARVTADLGRLHRLVEDARHLWQRHRADPWAAPLGAQLSLGLVELGADDEGQAILGAATALAPEDPHDRIILALARAAIHARQDRLEIDAAMRMVERAQALRLDHLARVSLGFTTRWSGTAQHRQLTRLIRQARSAGDRYGACWLGVASEGGSAPLREARRLGFLAMAEGRAMPA